MSVQTQGFRLSPQQEQQWIVQQQAPGYVMQSVLRLPQAWSIVGLHQALETTIQRHEALRTTFRRLPGMAIPIQVIASTAALDWQAGEVLQTSDDLARLAAQERAIRFDLANGPLVRACVSRYHDHLVLIVTIPAIAADRWSLQVIIEELIATYTQTELPAADEIAQYLQFSEWQSEVQQEQAEHAPTWTIGAPQATMIRLPFEQLVTTRFTAPTLTATLPLSSQLSSLISNVADHYETTVDRVFLASWATLFWHQTQQSTLDLGLSMPFRAYDELQSLVGPVRKVLPVQLDYAGDFRFEELIQAGNTILTEREQWAEGYSDAAPIANCVGFEYTTLSEFSAGIAVIEQTALDYPWAIKLDCHQTQSGLQLTLSAQPERFTEAALVCLLEQLQTILTAGCTNPEQPIAQIPLLGDWQRQHLIDIWNQTSQPLEDRTIHQLLQARTASHPDAIAIRSANLSLTYAELEAKSNSFAQHLLALGMGGEALIAVALDRSPNMLIAILAILKAGGAYVPIDLNAPIERTKTILATAGVVAVVTEHCYADRFPNNLSTILLDQLAIEEFSTIAPNRVVHMDQVCYVIHTSGSTGEPKGVVVTHRGLINYLTWACTAYAANGHGAPVHSPLGFDLTVTSLFLPLLLGQTISVLDEQSGIEALGNELQTNPGFSFVKLTPAHLEILNHTLPPTALIGAAHGFVVGGEALRSELLTNWVESAPALWIVNEYGPTETVVGCCTYTVQGKIPNSAVVPIGRPIANTRLYVLDPHGELAPVGIAGELYIGGVGVARGYLQRPDLTAERFVPDPWSSEPSARMYRTGDLVRYAPDGNLEFLGRNDQQVKIRGFRVELGEIETQLKAHTDVRDAVAALQLIDNQARLVAYYVAKSGRTPQPNDLARFLQQQLPEHMIPSMFIGLGSIPLTTNGKVDRKALPIPSSEPVRAAYVSPRTQSEKILADVWTQVLGIDQIGIHDSFFSLGGDSILGVQVVARAQRAGIRITPKQLFDYQTLAELAAVATTSKVLPSENTPVIGEVPLGPIQQWFFDQPIVARQHWNQSILLELDPRLTVDQIAQSILALQEHHDMLRARFEQTSAGWRQWIATPNETSPLQVIDLHAADRAAFAAALLEHSTQIQTSLDLVNGPLVQAVYYRGGLDYPTYLLIVAHHLLVDGVSWRILLEDMQIACEQLLQGNSIQLAPRTDAFKTWSETVQLSAAEVAVQASAWQQQPFDQCFPLPRDTNYAGSGEVGNIDVVTSMLDQATTTTLLREIPARLRASINELLLTALVEALAQWTGRRSALIEMEGHGRGQTQLDLSRTVGWFTALYPVALAAPAHGDLIESLQAIKAQLRSLEQQSANFGTLCYVAQAPEVQMLPTPEIAFNYLGQFDQLLDQATLFKVASTPIGPNTDPRSQRSHLLELTGLVTDGQLQVEWAFSPQIHHRETINTLAEHFNQALRMLVQSANSNQTSLYSAVDFPHIQATPDQIAALTGGQQVDEIYPLTATQAQMYAEFQQPGNWAYCNQMRWRFRGHFDPNSFERACRHVSIQHPALRTTIAQLSNLPAVQIVANTPAIAFTTEDWSNQTEAQQQQALQVCYEQERIQGFALQAPLWRVRVIRLSSDDYALIWTHHHIMLDGWSMAIVLRDVFAAYEALLRNQVLALPPALPFGSFIEWWSQQRWDSARDFWQSMLANFTAPAPLPQIRSLPEAERYGEIIRQLPITLSERLRQLARQQRLTLNTIIQGCWGLALGQLYQHPDMLVGVTLSGRPPELEGIETCVGLLINTLPIRLQIDPHMHILEWLRNIQDQLVAIREYETLPLEKLAEWGIQKELTRFESIVRFENYPTDKKLNQAQLGLEATDFTSIDRWPYPLCLIAKPGEMLELELSFWQTHIELAQATTLLTTIEHLLEGLVAQPSQTLGQLLG